METYRLRSSADAEANTADCCRGRSCHTAAQSVPYLLHHTTHTTYSEADSLNSRVVALSKDVERLTTERETFSKKLSQVSAENDSLKQDNVRTRTYCRRRLH